MILHWASQAQRLPTGMTKVTQLSKGTDTLSGLGLQYTRCPPPRGSRSE